MISYEDFGVHPIVPCTPDINVNSIIYNNAEDGLYCLSNNLGYLNKYWYGTNKWAFSSPNHEFPVFFWFNDNKDLYLQRYCNSIPTHGVGLIYCQVPDYHNRLYRYYVAMYPSSEYNKPSKH